MYAHDNGGWFPHGLKTPEASLTILCTNDPTIQSLLVGKHLPKNAVSNALASNGILDPGSCGWHYVEGLWTNDSGDIAILWDKVRGYDHNARRVSNLAHEVITMDGSMHYILKKDWAEFTQRQRQLLAEAVANRPLNSPPIRWSDEETLGPNLAKPGALKH